MGKIEEMNARVRAWGAGLDRRAREWVNLHPEKPEKPQKPQKLCVFLMVPFAFQ